MTVSDYLARTGVDIVDLMKIDIEGSEGELFLSPTDPAIWLDRVRVLAIEIHNELRIKAPIYAILDTRGFTVFETGELTIAHR